MVDAWADAADVLAVTGESVTGPLLAQAQADIEIFSNRIYADADRIRTRDLYWLGRAVAFQAAWLTGQFGVATRLNSKGVSQDGVSSQLAEHGMVLAPKAAKALQRCSWMRSRTVHIRSAVESAGLATSALAEAQDDAFDWQPTGGGH